MNERRRWLSAKAVRVAVALPVLVLAEGIALGANGPLLAVLASAFELGAALLVLLSVPPDIRFWRGAWPVAALLSIAALWAAVPMLGVGGGIAPDLALSGFARFAGSAAIALAAGVAGYRRGLARATVNGLIAAGAAQILVGLVLRSVDPQHVWGFAHSITGGRFSGTMINANANAALAAATAVLAFGRAQAFVREEPATTLPAALARIGCVLTAMLAAGACVIAGSRASVVLVVLAMLALVLLDPIFRTWLRRPVGIASFVGGLAAVAVVLALTGMPAIDRFVTLDEDSVGRLMVWGHYGALALRAPPFGYGLVAFSEMNAATLATPADAFAYWYINSAHNQPIELVLEGGLVYALAILAAVALMAAAAVRQVGRHRDDPVMRAALAASATIGGASLVDIALDVPAVVTLACVLTGLMWGRAIRAQADLPDR